MLLNLSPAQRNEALQSALVSPLQSPVGSVPGSARRLKAVNLDSPQHTSYKPRRIYTPVSDDSSITQSAEDSGGSEDSKTRVHSKNRVTRLASKMCKDYLNSERMYNYLYGDNNRVIEHKLDYIIDQIKAQLTRAEQKTQKTHRELLKKVIKKRMAAARRYRNKQKSIGRTLEEAHKSATIDLTGNRVDDDDDSDLGEDGEEDEDYETELEENPKDVTNKDKKIEAKAQKVGPAVQAAAVSSKNAKVNDAKDFKSRMDKLRKTRKSRRTKMISRKARGLPVAEKTSKKRKPSASVENVSKKKRVTKTFPFPLGTHVARDFDGEVFEGEITALYSDENTMCEVTYTDGDKEDMDVDEVTYGTQLHVQEFGAK